MGWDGTVLPLKDMPMDIHRAISSIEVETVSSLNTPRPGEGPRAGADLAPASVQSTPCARQQADEWVRAGFSGRTVP
ncbi:hypothetical protein MFU01_70600 [Myxococcus fulvus]|uniref:Uncharacterized protein n=1 Tax=Myxococcus fulvus TaxID=33 RepID=A0A511TED5_MYXFU|nr:hypothetical protein MFU01_70600 [Myxococcus fulvus]